MFKTSVAVTMTEKLTFNEPPEDREALMLTYAEASFGIRDMCMYDPATVAQPYPVARQDSEWMHT